MRNPEQEIDLSLFEEISDKDVLDYIQGKYSKEVAEEIIAHINKIVEKEV